MDANNKVNQNKTFNNFHCIKLFDSRFVANKLNNSSRCPKCRNDYSFYYDVPDKFATDNQVKSNRPILLPCGHNMCENCVYNNRHNLICARLSCLLPVALPKIPDKQFSNFNVRDHFDLNFFLMGQLNHWRFFCKDGSANATSFMSAADRSNLKSALLNEDANAASQAVIKCVECENLPSVGKCRTCKAYYCKRCFDNIHKNSKVLKKHTLQYFDRQPMQQSELWYLMKSRYCKRHQRYCDRYCKKCDCICCGECARFDHQNHNYRKLLEENSKFVEELHCTLDNAQLVRENLNKGQKDIKIVETQFEEYATKTLEEISNYFVQLHSSLQNEEKRIMEMFREMSQVPQLRLREANMKLNESQDIVNTIRSSLEQYQHALPANFYLGHILSKCNQLMQQMPSNIQITKPQDNPFVFEIKHDVRRDIENSINCEYVDPNLLIRIDTSFYDSNPSIMDTTDTSMPSMHNKIVKPQSTLQQKVVKNKRNKNTQPIQDICVSAAVPPTNYNLDDTNLVHITNIKSPENFYVQNINDIQSIRKLSHTYLCNGLTNKIPRKMTEGRYYMAYHITDKQWYRGKLKQILPNDVYKMFLIDFGLSLEVSRDNICEITEEHLKIPFAAIRCAIYDIMPTGKKWTEVENSLLLELVQNKPARISIIEKLSNDIYKIDLHTDLSKSVRDTFLYTGLARERSGLNSFKLQAKVNLPIVKSEERIPQINLNNNEILAVTVLHLEGPDEFFVIKNDLIESKEEVLIELNQYYHNNSSKLQHIYLGSVQMCCAVNVDDVWYRALIEEIKDKGQINVRLVDEGRRELINWRQAFVLTETFRNKREFAIPCTLADIEPLQENNYVYTSTGIKSFRQMTKNPQLRMEVVAVTPNSYKVVLYICKKEIDINIGGTLVKQRHGISVGEYTQVADVLKTPKMNRSANSPSALAITSRADNYNTSASSLNPIKRTLIEITHVISPAEFYIKLSSLVQGTKAFHQQIQETQAKKIGNKQPLPYESREWYEDNHCLVYTKYQNSQVIEPADGPLFEQFEWYRGIITKVTCLPGEEPTFSVFLRDVGVTICSIYSQQLYSIDPQLDRVTNAVYCCHLACIEPAGGKAWSQSAIDSFTHYVITAEALSVSLYDKRNGDRNSLGVILWSSKMETSNPLAPCITKYSNINRILVRKGLAHMVEPLNTKQQFDQIEEIELTNGEITLEQWFKSFSDNALLKEIENNENLKYLLANADDATGSNELYIGDHPLSVHLSEVNFKETSGQRAPQAWFTPKIITKTIFTAYPTYIDFDAVIYLHEADDKNFLENLSKLLTESYAPVEHSWPASQFGIDQACVVKYHVDCKFYRGIITEDINSQNEFGVKFIDYGNVERVESKDLRPYAPFPELPAMASKYVIDGIKPNAGAKKFSINELDQMHAMLVSKFVSVRIDLDEIQKNIKCCSMSLGACDVATDLIDRGLAEPDCRPVHKLPQLGADVKPACSGKSRKCRNPLPSDPADDYAIFNEGRRMSIDHSYLEKGMEYVDKEDNFSDGSADVDNNDNGDYNHLNEMLNRLSENRNTEEKKLVRNAVQTSTSMNVTSKPPPKKRMFNDNDYTKMMNVMMVYDTGDIVDNFKQHFDHGYNEIDDEDGADVDDDDDVIELGESFAMSYWHNTVEDMREEEDDEIDEQLKRRILSFDEEMESDFEFFHPNETSTVFSHFSGIEKFKAPQLPSAMHHFKCRVAAIMTPTILQIFPQHNEFRYRDVELQRSIKEIVKRSLPPLTNFEPRTSCLACYTKDKHWYRAIVRSYNPTARTVDVLYVDYLNSETLPLKYVRQCPKELLGWPLRTFRVRLHGIEFNSKVKEREICSALQKLFSKRDLFAIVKKHPSNNSTVSGKTSKETDQIEIALYESKEASLKGITIYEPLIERNYFKRL